MFESIAAFFKAAPAVAEKLAPAAAPAREMPLATAAEPLKIVTVPLADAFGIKIEALAPNVAARTEYAGFFQGFQRGAIELPQHARAFGLRVETPLGHLDVSLADDSLLGRLRLNEPIVRAIDPALRAFEQVRFDQLHATDVRRRNILDQLAEMPGLHFVFEPTQRGLAQLADLERHCLAFAEKHGHLLVAKRVDYLQGAQYVAGDVTSFPLVGGLADLLARAQLRAEITPENLVRAGSDVLLIVLTVAAPYALPAGASLTATLAIQGAAIGATHGAVTNGLMQYIRTGDAGAAAQAAGIAALEGGALGAAGGAAFGGVVSKIGTALKFRGAADAAAGGKEAVGRVIHGDSAWQKALADIDSGAMDGVLRDGATRAIASSPSRTITAIESRSAVQAVEYESTLAKRSAFEKAMSSAGSLEARAEIAAQYAQEGAYLATKALRAPLLGKWLREYAQELRHVDGIDKALQAIGSGNYQKGRGHFTEVGRAAYMQRRGIDLAALDKPVLVPGFGRTDIDILTRAGEWIENKHEAFISRTPKFVAKIDKMAAAVEQGLTVFANGEPLTILRATFVNSGRISAEAIAYAESKGIAIVERLTYRRPLPFETATVPA